MTSTRQDKTGTTDAVELNDAALDKAAGGGGAGSGVEPVTYSITLTRGVVPGDGSVRFIKADI